MSIRHTILGFLSWKPFTGYDLKKLFADSLSFYWTGNNNQIYGTLIQLHKDGAVEIEVQQQEKYPARKVYSITQKGRDELKEWLLSEPELPHIRNLFQLRLAWSDMLSNEEIEGLILDYIGLLEAQVIMCRETARRGGLDPARSPRETFLWKKIEEGLLESYERELSWAHSLKAGLAAFSVSPASAGGKQS